MEEQKPDAAPTGGGSRLTDRQLTNQLNEYLAPHGQSIDGLVAELIRCLGDETAFTRLCRRVTSNFGTNTLQVVLTQALKRIGRDGYRRPGWNGGPA